MVLLGSLASLAGCGTTSLRNPVRLTLVNRSGGTVTGALLRFDRELSRVDRVSAGGFADVRLRLSLSDTLRLEGGALAPDASVTYELSGRDGAPRLIEGRWLVDGRFGAPLDKEEYRLE